MDAGKVVRYPELIVLAEVTRVDENINAWKNLILSVIVGLPIVALTECTSYCLSIVHSLFILLPWRMSLP